MPYREITITEVASRADLSRRTFYRHFETVGDVLNYLLERLTEQFIAFLAEQMASGFPVRNVQSVVFLFFTYWEQHKAFLVVLRENDLLFLLLQRFLPAVRAKLHGDTMKAPNALIHEYVFAFAAGGIWNMVVMWIEAGAELPPHEMEYIAGRILSHLV